MRLTRVVDFKFLKTAGSRNTTQPARPAVSKPLKIRRLEGIEVDLGSHCANRGRRRRMRTSELARPDFAAFIIRRGFARPLGFTGTYACAVSGNARPGR
jgi:hypothetical protein